MPSRAAVALVVCVLAAALTAVLVLVSRRRIAVASPRSRARAVLLVGPSNSGKTTLFNRWTSHKTRETLTSVAINKAQTCEKQDGFGTDFQATIVDLPGHEKLQHLTSDALADKAGFRAVVFVIDAASGADAISEAAKRLYALLLRTEPLEMDVLVAANKADLFNTLSPARIASLLETEINTLRTLKQRGLGDSGTTESEEQTWLGLEETFRFEHLAGHLDVLTGSARSNTDKWNDWLSARLD